MRGPPSLIRFFRSFHRFCFPRLSGLVAFSACLFPPGSAFAQNSCPAPNPADFQVTTVTTILQGLEPIEIAVDPDGRVFWVQIHGEVMLFDPAAGKARQLAKLSVHSGSQTDDGVLGLALATDFGKSRWLYIFYAPKDAPRRYHLSRFTWSGDTLANEKVLLAVSPAYDQLCHTAGSLAFGPDGSLYLSTGDNSIPQQGGQGYSMTDERAGRGFVDAQGTTANSNDLRGKILRIRPLPIPENQNPAPGPGSTYSIPPGNLFPLAPGGTAQEKTRPEIFAMGLRNPYRIAVDPATGWLFWGEVGPDAGAASSTRGPMGSEEFNLARTPGNFGWPYMIGAAPYLDWDFAKNVSNGPFDPANLVNNSPNNTGLARLPVARAPLLYNDRSGKVFLADGSIAAYAGPWGTMALGGPVYRYDPELRKAGKKPFPPYFDGHWIIGDWTKDRLRSVAVTADGQVKSVQFLTGQAFPQVMDMAFGPDGSLYVLEWGGGTYRPNSIRTRIAKISYTGTLDDACYQPPVALRGLPGRGLIERRPILAFQSWMRAPEGARQARIVGSDGRTLWHGVVQPGRPFRFAARAPSGIAWVEFR